MTDRFDSDLRRVNGKIAGFGGLHVPSTDFALADRVTAIEAELARLRRPEPKRRRVRRATLH
jgi:hypothetical protein